jgi:hypothetical protein
MSGLLFATAAAFVCFVWFSCLAVFLLRWADHWLPASLVGDMLGGLFGMAGIVAMFFAIASICAAFLGSLVLVFQTLTPGL